MDKDLTKVHTKTLLGWLNCARRCGGQYDPYYEGHRNFAFSIEELKAELAKRPHIRNKKEAKAYRREMARRRI